MSDLKTETPASEDPPPTSNEEGSNAARTSSKESEVDAGARASHGERSAGEHSSGTNAGTNGKHAKAAEADSHEADSRERDSHQADSRERDSHQADSRERDSGTGSKNDLVTAANSGTVAAVNDAPPLLPRGNPLRRRALWLGSASTLFAFLLMAKNGQLRIGVPLGVIFTLLATFSVLDFIGSFDDKDEPTQRRTLSELAAPFAVSVGAFVLFAAFVGLAGLGLFQGILGGLLVTASFIGLIIAVFRFGVVLGPWKHDENGAPRPLHLRHGFWVLVTGALLYFPTLGIFSLWDPWETHYGEVAREILARDDWISLWWAQDGWFWSKPILNFWIQSLSMATLGTHFRSDQMMSGFGGDGVAHPEWVVRTPNVLFTLAAMYLLYKGVAKVFGRRAGMIGAIVLATTPDWYFLAHQTMTDMPFVAAMTAAMGLLMLGLYTGEDKKVALYEIDAGGRKFKVSLFHLVFGIVVLCALPQALYLLSRNLELVLGGDGAKGFRPHFDEFRSGSALNCGLPGNEACNTVSPAQIPKGLGNGIGGSLAHFFGGLEPSLQGFVWLVVLGVLLYVNWGERRVRHLCYIAAWFCTAIATMGKGPAGFILPAVCAFAYLATKRRFSELLRLEFLSGLLILGCVAAPWFVAMYVRHGSPFVDRLFFHDMFNRAFGHVHDTNEGDDTSFRFYIWQLGYALFPWTGLAPLGMTYWLRRSDSADKDRGDLSVLLVMWALFAFALFTFMGTKFHHYIFPAVPPISMLIGIVLDDMLGKQRLTRAGSAVPYYVGLGVGAGVVVYGLSRVFPGSVMGTIAGHDLTPVTSAAKAVGVAIALLGGALIAASIKFFGGPIAGREEGDELETLDVLMPLDAGLSASGASPGSRAASMKDTAYRDRAKIEETVVSRFGHERLMVGAAAVSGVMLLVLVGRDLALDAKGTGDQPGAIRLLQLFTYNYRRPWPDSLDFTAVLTAFSIAGALFMFFLAVRRLRAHAVATFAAFAVVWALWGTDVYMMKTSPHWGQHELIEAYYRDRKGPNEMLVAYQMNWKGENFYTSNHVPAFVSTGSTFTTWMKDQRAKGTKVMYFVTEHGRIGGLKSEVAAKAYTELTDKALCNKFVLVRAEL